MKKKFCVFTIISIALLMPCGNEAAPSNFKWDVDLDLELEKDPNCICENIRNPVCASNGRTYPNPCEFRCVAVTPLGRFMNLYIKHYGICGSIPFTQLTQF